MRFYTTILFIAYQFQIPFIKYSVNNFSFRNLYRNKYTRIPLTLFIHSFKHSLFIHLTKQNIAY